MTHADHPGCQWFEQVWNARRPETAIETLTAPDVKAHGADGETRGATEFMEFYGALVTAVPDIHVHIVNCVRGGDHVAVHWHATGTHTGPFLGQPPSGKAVDVQGLTLMRLEGNRLAEGWDSYDFASLMTQMDIADQPRTRVAGQGS